MKRGRETKRRILCLTLSFVMVFACIGFLPGVAYASPHATAVQVVAGANHTLVRLSNGEVWAWGSNSHGQLGVNPSSISSNSTPERVHLNGNATYIAAGHNSSYAIVGGRLYAWGSNSHGQLGVLVGSLTNNRRHTPAQVTGLPSGLTQVVAGEAHVLTRAGSEVWAFGRNDQGQAAVNRHDSTVLPMRTDGTGNTAFAISAGANHSLSINHSSALWGAGLNSELQIARPSSTLSVSQYLNWGQDWISQSVTMAAGGNNFTLALVGSNVFAYSTSTLNGIVGHSGTPTFASSDRRASNGSALNHYIDDSNQSINFIAAGHNHALAVNTAGAVFAWGNNNHGQLGNGTFNSTTPNNFRPVRVNASGFPTVTSVAGGGTHSVAIGNNGSLWAWGGNASGQLGNGTTTASTTPVQILGSNGLWASQTGNANFSFQQSTGTITGLADSNVHNLEIPSQINGVTVRHIASNAFDNVGLTGTLTIANTVHTIGQNAFRNNSITSVTIPGSVIDIGAHAFANNSNLTTANFLHMDTTLLRTHNTGGILSNSDIFLNTHFNLRLYRATGSSPASVPAYHGRTWHAGATGGTTQGNFSFSRVGNYYTVTGFTGNISANTTVVIPRTGPTGAQVRTVAGTIFQGMSGTSRNNITSITFESPSNVTTIAPNAFSGLSGLRSATVPASVQSIGTTAFANNVSLTEVHFEHLNGSTLRLGQVFMDASIFAGVPSGTLRLTRPTSSDAATYVSFNSPAGVPREWFVGEGNTAWWNFTPISGTGPITITGFTGPSNLTTLTIPSTINGRAVTAISSHVLTSSNTPNLQEVVIPASVQTFSSNAISGSNLVTARFLHPDGAAIHTIPVNTFGNPDTRNSNFRILFPVHSIGFTQPTWRGFPTQSDLGGHWEYSEWTGQGLIITGFAGDNTSIQIPASIGGRPVRYIGPNVFNNNHTLRELSIPASVVFISDNAVNNAPNLEIVHLAHTNANVFTYFPQSAFVGVHTDFRIYFPANSQGFTTPMWNGFNATPQMWTYTITSGQVTVTGFNGHDTVITIPSYIQGLPVRVIAGQAFVNNPHVTSIIIPPTVTTIQRNAVFNCLNLTSVMFTHTDANTITDFAAYAFVGIAPNFRIMFPYGAAGFTTPAWRGYFAEPETGQLVLQYGDFEYTIRRVTLPGAGNVSRDEVVITRYLGFASNVVIPASIAGIPVGGLGDVVFFQNSTLTQVTLPNTLRTIGNSTFAGATNITFITLPASVTSIGTSAFMGASRLIEVSFNNINGADVTIGANAFANTAFNFRITYPPTSPGFATPSWRGVPAFPRGSAPPVVGGNQPPGGQQPPASSRSFPVRTSDTFPGVTGPPIFFRDGVGYVSIRAFAILIESDPNTQILFNEPISGWATIIGRHTDGREVMMAVTSNDERVSVMINGVHHAETDLAAWAGPLTGRARGQLSTINEGGNIFLPFRAVANIFGYDIEMLDSNTIQFTAP